MMEQVHLPKDLIRYDSEEGIKNKKKKLFTRRTFAYSLVLLALLTLLGSLLFSRNDIEATVLRTPGTLFQKNDDGTYSNLYNLEIINKTYEDIPITLKIEGGVGRIQIVGTGIIAKKESKAELLFLFLFLHLKPPSIPSFPSRTPQPRFASLLGVSIIRRGSLRQSPWATGARYSSKTRVLSLVPRQKTMVRIAAAHALFRRKACPVSAIAGLAEMLLLENESARKIAAAALAELRRSRCPEAGLRRRPRAP